MEKLLMWEEGSPIEEIRKKVDDIKEENKEEAGEVLWDLMLLSD